MTVQELIDELEKIEDRSVTCYIYDQTNDYTGEIVAVEQNKEHPEYGVYIVEVE